MLDVYSGNVTTERRTGRRRCVLPAYFDKINTDFRYQLTVIGQFAQAIVGKEIANNQVRDPHEQAERARLLAGDRAAQRRLHAARIRSHAEQAKTGAEQGKYVTPALYGKPASRAVDALPGGSQGKAVKAPGIAMTRRPKSTPGQPLRGQGRR